jgi:chemotaxis protein MotB
VDKTRPIIIVKKKAGHGGHHGGAWKVAYADFVTAMMAFFMVMWLLNTSKPVKEAIAGYFKDPSGTGAKLGTTMTNTGEAITVTKDNMAKLKEELEKSIKQMPDFEKLQNQVEMTITPEGLRIELLETASGTFFEVGSPKPNDKGRELLVMLADQLGKLPNKISIEGHTDSKPYNGKGEYSNWELSADRANAARRLMQQKGLGEKQVTQVRGYADQRLRKPDAPLDASNRRISVIVQYLEKKKDDDEKTPEKPGAEAKPSGESAPVGEAKPAVNGKPPADSKPSAGTPIKTE